MSRLPNHGGERITALGAEYRSCKFVKLLLLACDYTSRTQEVKVLCGYQAPLPTLDLLGGWCRLQEPPRDALMRHVMAKVSPGLFAGDILLPLLRAHLALQHQEQGMNYMIEQAISDPAGLLPPNFTREIRVYVWALDAGSLCRLLDTSLIRQDQAAWRPLRAFTEGLPPYYYRAVWAAARTVFPNMSPQGRLGA